MITEKNSILKISILKRIINKDYVFIGLLVLLFFGIGFVNILNHESWRDEIEAWLIAKDSNSVSDLFRNFRLEGHPCLWFLCLHLISRFTDQMFYMQLFHLILATASILIVAKFSPFTRLQKVLLIFSYFLFYEYATISRNYALGILLIFSICSLFRIRKKSHLYISILLFFLCQTNIFGLIIAILFGFALITEYVMDKDLQCSYSAKKWTIIMSVLILVFGISISILQMLPPSDSVHVVGWNTFVSHQKILRTFRTIWCSYFPIPKFVYHFWGTNILESSFLQINFACILVLCICVFFTTKPIIFYIYSLGTFGMLAFFYLKYYGSLRHHGHLFILLVVCFWIANYYTDFEVTPRFLKKLTNYFVKIQQKFITVLFSLQFIAAIIAIGFDWNYPFSASKEVVTYIKDNEMGHLTIAGDTDYATQFVSAYLNKKIYYPIADRYGSFVIWDNKSSLYRYGYCIRDDNYTNTVLTNLHKLSEQEGKDVLLVLSYPLSKSNPFIKLKSFNQSIVRDETYHLYLIKQNIKHSNE